MKPSCIYSKLCYLIYTLKLFRLINYCNIYLVIILYIQCYLRH